MNIGRFIPNKINSDKKMALSSTAIKFAGLTIVVGIFTLILAFSILSGFKKYIQDIVYQYNGHFEVMKLGSGDPVRLDSGLYVNYKEIFPQIEKIRAATYIGGIVQNEETVEGVMIKGYDSTGIADMNSYLIDGEGASMEDERKVLISQSLANRLQLKTKDDFIANFFDGNIKYRKLKVAGIFKTNLTDFDNKMIIAPMPLVVNLFQWDSTKAARMEVILKKNVNPDFFYEDFRMMVGFDLDVVSAQTKFIHLFAWLKNLDQNVSVLIVILFVLVLFSIISTMYILVYEKNQMVGVLKTLGASDMQILSVFRSIGLRIGVVGLVLGNLFGITFLLGQKKYEWLKLDPEHYYLSHVPVEIDWMEIISINLISVFVILLILTIPYFVIVKMRPIENLKFG